MQITVAQLQANAMKYLELAKRQDIIITDNGLEVARLTTARAEKVAAARALFGILPQDASLDAAKEERYT